MKMARIKWMVLGVMCTAGAARATNVAVVNVARASEKYFKTSDLEGQFEGIRRKLGQERDGMKEKVERANKSLQEELKPGTDEFRQRKKEISLMEAELQWFVDSEGQKIEQGLALSLRSIFDDIRTTAKEVADERGFDIVMASDNLPADTPDSPNQVRQHILLQKVLYWNEKVDITDEVVNRLNAKYKSSGGATVPKPPPQTSNAANPAPDPAKNKPKEAPPKTEPKKKP